MTQIGWRFPPLSGGTRQGYTNNDIEAFKGQELIDNLAREICQNSLDARSEKADGPVKVVFELREIENKKFDVFSKFEKCLNGCRDYWKDEMDNRLTKFVERAEATLEKDTIPVLVAADYNTKGLSGSHSHELSSPWEALTGSDGVSVKGQKDSAGSFGIGKNAPFACSSLSMVFYNTVAEDRESGFIGVARVATLLNEDGKPTQRVGKYQVNDEENEIWNPIYPSDNNSFRDCFTRTEQGTDVIIVGFTQSTDWFGNVTKAVLKNFFVAISEGRLVVELRDKGNRKTISADTIAQMFSDLADDPEMISASQLYTAFVDPGFHTYASILEEDDVELFVRSDSSYKRTIANFRSSGMLVGTHFKRIFQHYAAVVVVRGEKLGELLKETEPAKHNKWDYKQIEKSEGEKRALARDCINKIDAFVLNVLKSQFEVVKEDTVDAAGVGEYLPDSVDGLEGQAAGDDILKVKVKIGKMKTNPVKKGSMTQSGTKQEGTKQEGDIHNHEDNPDPLPPHPRPPKPVIPNPDDPDPQTGATPGSGTKTMRTPNLSAQRAFPINSSQGLYKIVIKPEEDYEKLYVECFAMGEDGKTDSLNIETFTSDGRSINISEGKAGPIKVTANTPAVFFARFSNQEKMKLRLRLTEG